MVHNVNSIGQDSIRTKILGGSLLEDERQNGLRNPWIEDTSYVGESWCKVSVDHKRSARIQ